MILGMDKGRIDNVRDYSFKLVAATTNAVKLRDRGFQAAVVFALLSYKPVQINDILNRSLTKSRFADDDAAVIVLYSAGKYFRRRGTIAIDQYRQWAAVGNGGVGVIVNLDVAGRIPRLDYGA